MQRLRSANPLESDSEYQLVLKQQQLANTQSHSPRPPQQILPPSSTFSQSRSIPGQQHHFLEGHPPPREQSPSLRQPPAIEERGPLQLRPGSEDVRRLEFLRQNQLEELRLFYRQLVEEEDRLLKFHHQEDVEEELRLMHLHQKMEQSQNRPYHIQQQLAAEEEDVRQHRQQRLFLKQKEQQKIQQKLQLIKMEEDRLKQHMVQLMQHQQQHHQQQPTQSITEEEHQYRIQMEEEMRRNRIAFRHHHQEEHMKRLRQIRRPEEDHIRHIRAIEEHHHMNRVQHQQQGLQHARHAALPDDDKPLRQKLDNEKKQQQQRLKKLEEQQIQLRQADTTRKLEAERSTSSGSSTFSSRQQQQQQQQHVTSAKQSEDDSLKAKHQQHQQHQQLQQQPTRISSPRLTVDVSAQQGKRAIPFPKQMGSPSLQPPQQEFLQQQVEEAVRLRQGFPLPPLVAPELPPNVRHLSSPKPTAVDSVVAQPPSQPKVKMTTAQPQKIVQTDLNQTHQTQSLSSKEGRIVEGKIYTKSNTSKSPTFKLSLTTSTTTTTTTKITTITATTKTLSAVETLKSPPKTVEELGASPRVPTATVPPHTPTPVTTKSTPATSIQKNVDDQQALERERETVTKSPVNINKDGNGGTVLLPVVKEQPGVLHQARVEVPRRVDLERVQSSDSSKATSSNQHHLKVTTTENVSGPTQPPEQIPVVAPQFEQSRDALPSTSDAHRYAKNEKTLKKEVVVQREKKVSEKNAKPTASTPIEKSSDIAVLVATNTTKIVELVATTGHTPSLPVDTPRPESPDIYDMNLHDEEEDNDDSKEPCGFDLYSNMKPQSSDMKEIAPTDVQLFYTTPTEEATRDDDPENVKTEEKETPEPVRDDKVDTVTVSDSSKEELITEKVILQKTAETEEEVPPVESNRPGTPVLDEPAPTVFQTSSTTSKKGAALPNLKLPPNTKASGGTDEASPGSTPEAHTPLMDEPNEFNFETTVKSSQYLRFQQQNQPPHYTVPPTTTIYLNAPGGGNNKRPHHSHRKSTDAFESITPPSSPEHHGAKGVPIATNHPQQPSEFFGAAPPQPPAPPPPPPQPPQPANSVVAFPFSALAINVGSRPSSRSGSSCQSPGAAISDNSPRSDFEHGGGVNALSTGGSGRQLTSSSIVKSASKRKRDDSSEKESASFEQHSKQRAQKRSYRRSGSQSSSTSSKSKSPEYDFSKLKR